MSDKKESLENYGVTAEVFNRFVREITESYDQFLHGKIEGDAAQAEAIKIIERYAEIFEGNDSGYATAPWMVSGPLKVRLRQALDYDGDSAFVGYFTFLASQVQQAQVSMVNGMSESEAGERLGEILTDGIGRFMLIIK